MESTEMIYGIALLLFNDEEKIFCVKELTAKESIGKHVGDYSFPWETQEKGESDEHTIVRLIKEEVHSNPDIEISEPVFLGEVPVHHVGARIYAARFLRGPVTLKGLHAGTEIETLGWQTKDFLLSRCRDGVLSALNLFETHREKHLDFLRVR